MTIVAFVRGRKRLSSSFSIRRRFYHYRAQCWILIIHNIYGYDNRWYGRLHVQLTGFASLIISSLENGERERESAFDTEDRSRFSRLVSHGFINRTPYPLEEKRGKGTNSRTYTRVLLRVYTSTRRSHAYAICRLSSGMREYTSISCTFASNNACRHLARSCGYRGVKDAHVKRRRIHVYTRLLASVYTLRMYISAINTPNRFVNLGRWE